MELGSALTLSACTILATGPSSWWKKLISSVAYPQLRLVQAQRSLLPPPDQWSWKLLQSHLCCCDGDCHFVYLGHINVYSSSQAVTSAPEPSACPVTAKKGILCAPLNFLPHKLLPSLPWFLGPRSASAPPPTWSFALCFVLGASVIHSLRGAMLHVPCVLSGLLLK